MTDDKRCVYPRSVARFYDVIYKHINTQIDEDFYVKQMADCHGLVLDIGSGTGRTLCRALDEGIDIYGLEPSPHMIEICKSKLKPEDQGRLFQGRVETMALDKKFDLIVAPFRSFQHLLTFEDQSAALRKIDEHLNPKSR